MDIVHIKRRVRFIVHLHVHTEYSLLDAIIKIPQLIQKVKSMGQTAIAITDHGTLGGWVEFYKECKKEGIKPIFGCEFYHDKGQKKNNHLILLAKNKIGFENIITLNNLAITNFHRKPRITDEMIFKHSEGVIGLSACIQGYFQQTMLDNNTDWHWYHLMKEAFDGHFYVEVMDSGIREQKWLMDEVNKTDIHSVATVDCHYLNKDDEFAHRVSLGIMINKKIDDPKSLRFDGAGYYVKSQIEMEEVFSEESIAMSDTIAELVEEFDIGYENWLMPQMEVDPEAEFSELEFKLEDFFFDKGWTNKQKTIYKKRLKYEFGVIKDNGFLPYFKMVAGLCQDLDNKHIFRGWGRGSASGSLVSFLYHITLIDPIEWGLYFERFLNPDRISPPDIDLDFMPEHRLTAINYFKEHFGEVYQIGTYGTLGTKEVIKSCSRIMGEYTDLDQFVPAEAPVPTVASLMKTKAFATQAKKCSVDFINTILKLEGMKRNLSVHASGIIISDGSVPARITRTGTNAGVISTTWDMYALEDMKYVKFDILGVKNLAVIDKICKIVDVRVEDIKLDDDITFDLIRQCDTVGVFQWESDGFKNVIRKLQPDKFNELLDLNTLYRPACLESGLTDQYIRRKHGEEKVTPLHELANIEGQQGLPLYQEDVMKIVRDLAGFTLAEADTLRKAISKKKKEMFVDIQKKFIIGCAKNGIDEMEAIKLWDMIEKFSRYSWNKAHSVAYTLISWWTAYLSAHYPEVFFCELLNDADSSDRRRILFAECRKRKIEIKHPDINKSDKTFKVVNDAIVIGLQGIKFIGTKKLEKILKAREDGDFLDRADIKARTKLDKKAMEYLDKAGALGDIPSVEDEREALGYNVGKRMIDSYWWGHYMAQLGEIIDIHKITTKKGDPMAFLNIEYRDKIESVTVFPSAWEVLRNEVKKGTVGIFKADSRGVLVFHCDPTDYQHFKVSIDKPDEFMSFCPSLIGRPNVLVDGYGISSVKMNEEMLHFIEDQFGLVSMHI